MKTFGGVVLLLVASLHVFTPGVRLQTTAGSTARPATAPATAPAASAASTSGTAEGTKSGPAAGTTATQKAASTAPPPSSTPAARVDSSMSPESVKTPQPERTATSAPADIMNGTIAADAVNKTDNQTSITDHPSTDSYPKNHVVTTTRPAVNPETKTPPPEKTSPPADGKNGAVNKTDNQTRPLPEKSVVTATSPAATVKGGPGSKSDQQKDHLQADKRWWWILVPIGILGAAASIFLKFKSKKIHVNSETDTGTENASFQSRPENCKDGVMLLGVRSSGGEDSASTR